MRFIRYVMNEREILRMKKKTSSNLIGLLEKRRTLLYLIVLNVVKKEEIKKNFKKVFRI